METTWSKDARLTAFVIIAVLILGGIGLSCSSGKHKENADSAVAKESTVTKSIERVTVVPPGPCAYAADGAGNSRVLVKFFGEDKIYSFAGSDEWLLARREDQVEFRASAGSNGVAQNAPQLKFVWGAR
jgi:hypothetical protein